MDPHTWPRKSRTTSTNIHSAAIWGYGMLSWRPTLGQWTIGRSGERGSGISVLPARHDDDDTYIYIYMCVCVCVCVDYYLVISYYQNRIDLQYTFFCDTIWFIEIETKINLPTKFSLQFLLLAIGIIISPARKRQHKTSTRGSCLAVRQMNYQLRLEIYEDHTIPWVA